jgi:hypothetical protein
VQDYTVIIPTMFKDHHVWVECFHGFIRDVKETNKLHIAPVGAIIRAQYFGWEKAASDGIDCVWLVNAHVNSNTYWTVY